MNPILITGVAGFIGSHVARRFIAEGYNVIGVDDLSSGSIDAVPKEVDFYELDLSSPNCIIKLPSGCDKILHLAGQSSGEISFDDPISDLNKNTTSTLNLIRYGLNNESDRIVYASSMSVYGDVPDEPIRENYPPKPLSCYGVGKLAAERYLRIYQEQLPYTALRMFNVYGPGQDMANLRQGMVSIFLAQALKTGSIHVKGSTNRFRDLVFIDDVVEVWFRATFYPSAKNKILNVGTGKRTTVLELLEKICACVSDSDFFVEGSTPGDQNGIFADVSGLKEVLEIDQFRDIEDGLLRFVKWAQTEIKNENKKER